jgi:hypothetical protein
MLSGGLVEMRKASQLPDSSFPASLLCEREWPGSAISSAGQLYEIDKTLGLTTCHEYGGPVIRLFMPTEPRCVSTCAT